MTKPVNPVVIDDLHSWRGLLRCGGWSALASVTLIIIQVGIFATWPPVHTVREVFSLMNEAPVLGLISLDAIYIVNNLLVWLVYLGLGAALWPVSRSVVTLAVGLGTLQMAAYLGSNPAAEMLVLGREHAGADTERARILESAGEALLAAWKGTAFLTYYLLGAIVLLLLTWLLYHSNRFPRSATWWALAAGILMLVPSPFGTVGMVFALLSLLPWSVMCIVVGRRLLSLSSTSGTRASPTHLHQNSEAGP
nr:DUF4386 family protein [Actinomycetales bacterium]